MFERRISSLILGLVLCLAASAQAASSDVGYYIGSFDPPTLGHKAVAVECLDRFDFQKLYITVNHNTDKDFNTSVEERVQMLKLLFAEYGDRVEILREPIEGRQPFAWYLNRKHEGKIIGIFGDDTYDKNFKIFNGIENFDFIKVERPEITLESVTAQYVPVVHPVKVVADGLSSSLARDLIAKGKDASHVLSSNVMGFINDRGFYRPIPQERLSLEETTFRSRFQKFYADLVAETLGKFDLNGITVPKFKAGQSREAQNDKFIRSIIEQKKVSVDDQFVLRPIAERILGYSQPSKRLRSPKKAGLYYGSFDPPSLGQKEVMLQALKQLNLDVLYVSALESSSKPLVFSPSDRTEMLKLVAAEIGTQVVVLPNAPAGGKLSRFVVQIANEHTTPLIAIFGENVFEKNYNLLQGTDNLSFAVVPRSGAEFKVPQGVTVVKTEHQTQDLSESIKKYLDCKGRLGNTP